MPDEIDLLRIFRGETPEPSTDAWNRARAAISAARAAEEAARAGEGAARAEEAADRAARPGYGPARSRERRAGQRAMQAPRRRLLQAVGGLAAAAAVGGLLAALLPANGGRQTATAALVAKVSNALSAVSAKGNLVSYARTVYSSGDTAVSGGSAVTWAYRSTLRITTFDASGRRVWVRIASLPKHGTWRQMTVDYSHATWSQGTLGPAPAKPAAAARGCRPAQPTSSAIINSGGWPTLIGGALGCGALKMEGRQWVDGVDAIKLDSSDGGTVMWINPATYLPVRAILTSSGQRALTDFRWLSPTPADLGQLTVTIPPGFCRYPPADRSCPSSPGQQVSPSSRRPSP